MGKAFVEPPALDLNACFDDSAAKMPLIFVLSAGSDPMDDFRRFAESVGMGNKFKAISLGEGQGPKAEKMIASST